MAGIVDYEPRLKDCLSMSMWFDNGMQYRSNILHGVGSMVELHAHNYDHTARLRGKMLMVVIAPDGTRTESEMASGQEVFIPAYHQHSFTLLEGIDGIGEVLCFWSIS